MKKYFILTLFLLSMAAILPAQYFGKNLLQYERFKWEVLRTEHFDIYFYDELPLAQFAGEVCEQSYKNMISLMNYIPDERFSLIIYNSHIDFQQNNVGDEVPEEGVGGFTEFFKNRMVLPFEGDYEKFRHVIAHEFTHAYTLRYFYGSGVQSILMGMFRFQLPLWLMEGQAEYVSREGWDTESETFVRDAVINNYLPPFQYLYGYLNYKAGQSLFCYIADTYGKDKVWELFRSLRQNRNIEDAFERTFHIKTEKLNDGWHKYLQKKYYPLLDREDIPESNAHRLTNHQEDMNYLNLGGAISPDGEQIAYITDRSGYFELHLLDTDGKKDKTLLRGSTTTIYESLHWLTPGISWAQDNRRVVFSAKDGNGDKVYIYDVKSGKLLHNIESPFRSVFSPIFSPDGQQIAASVLTGSGTDIYIYDLAKTKWEAVTSDNYSDLSPSFSPDGKKILFLSDRDRLNIPLPNDTIDMFQSDYRQKNVFEIDIAQKTIIAVTKSRNLQATPFYGKNTDEIYFVSDRNGIANLVHYDRRNGVETQITNYITGLSYPSVDKDFDRLVFTAYYEGGFDLYLINKPFQNSGIPEDKLRLTLNKTPGEKQLANNRPSITNRISNEFSDIRNFVYSRQNLEKVRDNCNFSMPAVDTVSYKFNNRYNLTRNYKTRFTIDYIWANMGYSSYFGFAGTSTMALSDLLGNQRIYLNFNVYSEIENSNLDFSWWYLPYRIDLGFSLYHFVYFLSYDTLVTEGNGNVFFSDYVRDRNYGLGLYLSYPFSRFTRIDYGIDFRLIDRTFWDDAKDDFRKIAGGDRADKNKLRTMLNILSFSFDNTIWGYYGPVNGQRLGLAIFHSPDLQNDDKKPGWGLGFKSAIFDFRKYFFINREASFALRLTGGVSEGADAQSFYLGGIPNWVNSIFGDYEIDSKDLVEIYYSRTFLPLRGVPLYHRKGTRVLLMNSEFRFPVIDYFKMRYPVPLAFGNVEGAVFSDIGAVWDKDNYRGTVKDLNDNRRLNSLVWGYGWGARIYLGYFLLRMDVAWNTDLHYNSKPKYYFSLGANF